MASTSFSAARDESFFAAASFEDGVALAREVLVDDGADAGVVVADENGALVVRR